MFKAFDTDSSGTVQWKEMFAGLTQLVTGDQDDKASFYFALFDSNGNDQLETTEVLAAVLQSRAAATKSASDITALLGKLDGNGDGVVTIEEFRAAVREYPELLECFGTLFGSTNTSIDSDGPKPNRKERKKRAIVGKLQSAYNPNKVDLSRKPEQRFAKQKRTGRSDVDRAVKVAQRENVRWVCFVVGAHTHAGSQL